MSSAYSSDDSHRLPDPSSQRGSSTPGGGLKILMYLVFVLALVATIIMFFVDSEMWLNVAVITSLWAAFIGAILVARYSGVLGEERSRRQEQERRHRAELDYERSEAQRREGELEKDYRTRLVNQRDETLESIRQELEVMRVQLTDLSGAEWTDEQVSLKAQAERIIELERSSPGSTGSAAPRPGQRDHHEQQAETAQAAQAAQASRSAQRPAGGHRQPEERSGPRQGRFTTGTFEAVRWSGTDNEDTTQIPMVVDTRGLDDEKSSEKAETTAAETPAPAAEPEPEPEPTPEPEPAPEADAEPGRRRRAETEDEVHGRRRADEHSSGVTVAQLMAQMKKNAKP